LVSLSLIEVTVNRGRLNIMRSQKASHLGTLLFGVTKDHGISRTIMLEQRE
jgi:hypothetical protein